MYKTHDYDLPTTVVFNLSNKPEDITLDWNYEIRGSTSTNAETTEYLHDILGIDIETKGDELVMTANEAVPSKTEERAYDLFVTARDKMIASDVIADFALLLNVQYSGGDIPSPSHNSSKETTSMYNLILGLFIALGSTIVLAGILCATIIPIKLHQKNRDRNKSLNNKK